MGSRENRDKPAFKGFVLLALFHAEPHGSHKRASFLRRNQGSPSEISALSPGLQDLELLT